MTPDEQLYDGQPIAHIAQYRERQRLANKQRENREAYEAYLRSGRSWTTNPALLPDPDADTSEHRSDVRWAQTIRRM